MTFFKSILGLALLVVVGLSCKLRLEESATVANNGAAVDWDAVEGAIRACPEDHKLAKCVGLQVVMAMRVMSGGSAVNPAELKTYHFFGNDQCRQDPYDFMQINIREGAEAHKVACQEASQRSPYRLESYRIGEGDCVDVSNRSNSYTIARFCADEFGD